MLYDETNTFVGYTMKYYKPEKIDILTMPTDYTLENYQKIYNSAKKLDLSKASHLDLNIKYPAIIDAKEEGRLASIIEELLLKAYGKKSPDGRTFDKSEEISNEFKHTMAYSNIFIRLVSDANYTAKWIESVISQPTAQKETVSSFQPVTE